MEIPESVSEVSEAAAIDVDTDNLVLMYVQCRSCPSNQLVVPNCHTLIWMAVAGFGADFLDYEHLLAHLSLSRQ